MTTLQQYITEMCTYCCETDIEIILQQSRPYLLLHLTDLMRTKNGL